MPSRETDFVVRTEQRVRAQHEVLTDVRAVLQVSSSSFTDPDRVERLLGKIDQEDAEFARRLGEANTRRVPMGQGQGLVFPRGSLHSFPAA